MSTLQEIYCQALFKPSILSILVNPFYFARKGLYDAIKSFAEEITEPILDVGCGNKPYQHLFKDVRYIGLEIDSENSREQKRADYFYDGKLFPFEDKSFATVICNQVLEHVFEPEHLISEMSRCLKPGGKLLLTVPFVWDEHETPQDFARYSSFGLKYLIEKGNFKIVSQKKTISDVRVIFQLLSAYLYKVYINPKSRAQQIVLTALLVFPINVVGELVGTILPSNQDLYLDNVIFAIKI
jgi:SAM-dependent methyltransferase